MKLLSRFFILLMCVAPLSAVAAESYSQITLEYELSTRGFTVGAMKETYARSKDRYRITSVSVATGLLAAIKPETINVISEGTVTPQGLHPDTFSSIRKVDTDRSATASFDWTNKTVTLDDKRKGKRTLPLPDGTQDRASAMYQFMFLAMDNATALNFNMVNVNKLDLYSYRVSSGGRVKVPAGTFDTVYVASTPEPGKRKKTEIWLAREHGWLPCKMIITDEDGSRYTQELTKFSARP
ncbi:MAG: DUF3108 domain-containing protein [Gallionellaceae bacterium]|jgi:hypothetical protein|nr:DUF3108 domain-containing protein [Gallionellaceae bacterium]